MFEKNIFGRHTKTKSSDLTCALYARGALLHTAIKGVVFSNIFFGQNVRPQWSQRFAEENFENRQVKLSAVSLALVPQNAFGPP